MDEVAQKLRDFEEYVSKQLALGGPEQVKRQHELGKLTARERMELLCDEGTFEETDSFVKHRCTHYGMDKISVPAEGVVTGCGMVNGRPICVFADDFTAMLGTQSEMHAKKKCKVMELALELGVPIVGLNDSAGGRLQEGVDALASFGRVFYLNSIASGVVPQISAIMGAGVGGAAYSPALTDWIFMVEKKSYMFITGPAVLKEVIGEEVTTEELGGARIHASKTGMAHFIYESDNETIEGIKTLLSYLPSSCREEPPFVKTSDDPRRLCPDLDSFLSDNPRVVYDMRTIIGSFADGGFARLHRWCYPSPRDAAAISLCAGGA